MSDALRRAIRTLAQFLVSASCTALVNTVADGLTPTQKLVTLAGFQFAVTWAHNALEDRTPLPAVLKAVPSSGQNPVTVDPAAGSATSNPGGPIEVHLHAPVSANPEAAIDAIRNAESAPAKPPAPGAKAARTTKAAAKKKPAAKRAPAKSAAKKRTGK